MDSDSLRIVILYDAANNQYQLSAHNVIPDEAEKLIQEWDPQLVQGRSLLSINQSKHHRTQSPDQCRACRETVARASGLTPPPRFTRRLS